ncbi:MAG: Fe-S protein assembly co-chaperone HscB [Alistipes senegalensis]|nr:Fe-S protein assembly co-chaperone HscB [Oxalobacter formigenes]MCM1281739.1 Fe-S protein assembly co-chaperone HscB [Alistipes senegalensis]
MITSPFSLFGLPEQFDLNRAALEKAYKKYREHPCPAQPAALVDEAYQTLRQPLKRAACLCSLNGFPPKTGTTLSLPPEFLMEQITWRNQLDEALLEKRLDKLEELDKRLRQQLFQQLEKIRHTLHAREFATARQEIAKTGFLDKFAEEISFAFDRLEEPDKA